MTDRSAPVSNSPTVSKRSVPAKGDTVIGKYGAGRMPVGARGYSTSMLNRLRPWETHPWVGRAAVLGRLAGVQAESADPSRGGKGAGRRDESDWRPSTRGRGCRRLQGFGHPSW